MTSQIKPRLSLALCVLLFWSSLCNAACHPSSDWLVQPDNETRVVFTEDRVSSPLVQNASIDPTLVFPKTVSDTELAALSTVRAPWPKRVFATFFEPTANNTWRSCRQELWWIASQLSKSDRPAYELIRKALKPHKELLSLSETHTLWTIKLIHYDESGRLSKINEGSPSGDDPRRDTYCRRYDSANRITMSVKPEAGQCPTGQPLAEDRFEIYQYRPNTTDSSDKNQSYRYEQWPDKEDTWNGKGRVILDNDPKAIVGFKAQFAQGIVEMAGRPEARLGSKDDNPSNTVANYVINRGTERTWAGSTYVFTQPGVPFSVLENRDELYKYERRRVTTIYGRAEQLYELFKPNEHLSRDRYYFGSGTMLRHEQYDEQGRIKRIVTYRNYRLPVPGPNPTFNDDLLPPDPTSLRLLGRDIYHRVYDIDEQGKAKLVAMSWSDKHRISPFSKPKHLDFTYVIYGTPDGVEVWKNREEFDKAFNTDKGAKALFPDVQRREAEARRK
jgi:hypothetical protein